AEQISFPNLEPASDGSLVQSMNELHGRLQSDSGLGFRLQQAVARLEPEKARRLSALLALYSGDDSRLFNLIGPPGTVATIPYAAGIRGVTDEDAIRGKVVFVGADERQVVSRVDTFQTVFSSRDGFDLSGVEALATAFSNLSENKTLRSSALLNAAVIS